MMGVCLALIWIKFNSVKWHDFAKVTLQLVFISSEPLAGLWLGSKPVFS